MAVTRAEKEQELQDLTAAFKAASTAIVVDYRGLNVPAVTELRSQLKGAKAKYRVVKNTLAIRASKGTAFESLEKHFVGTTAVAYTDARRGGAGQGAHHVHEGRAGAEDQGGGGAGPGDQAGRGDRARQPAWQARAVRQVALTCCRPRCSNS